MTDRERVIKTICELFSDDEAMRKRVVEMYDRTVLFEAPGGEPNIRRYGTKNPFAIIFWSEARRTINLVVSRASASITTTRRL